MATGANLSVSASGLVNVLWMVATRSKPSILSVPNPRTRLVVWRNRDFSHVSPITATGGCSFRRQMRRVYSSHSQDGESSAAVAAAPEIRSVDGVEDSVVQQRRVVLMKQLKAFHIDADGLNDACVYSMQNSTNGYDNKYGKSAIRAYRSFLYPRIRDDVDDDDNNNNDKSGRTKKSSPYSNVYDSNPHSLRFHAAAERCARHIDFLVRRHRAAEEEYIRHHQDRTHNRNEAADQTLATSTFPLIIVLDNIRSATNVGCIFRTADAVGCSLLITTGITPHPGGSGSEKIRKSALGAEWVVPTQHFATTKDALGYIRTQLPTYQVVGVETTERSLSYSSHSYGREGVAFVFGNEVTGIDTSIIPSLDVLIEIPMFGKKNSLNVACCVPVILYETLRQWNA